MKAILSTTLILGEGTFTAKKISFEQAISWVLGNDFNNFCGHQTTKILGIQPAESREQCTGYAEALCLAPKERLEFGREYTRKEILEIGVDFTLISRV